MTLGRVVIISVVAGLLGVINPALAVEQRVTGFTRVVEDLALGLPVAGRIQHLRVKEGDRIARGRVILSLDKRLEDLEYKRRVVIRDDRTLLDAARQKVEILRRQLTATRTLYENSRSVSRDELDAKELELASATAERQRLELAEKTERLEADLARVQLDQRVLRAPTAGRIVKIHKRQGESVQTHEPVVQLVTITPCLFVANIEEALSENIQMGMKVVLHLKTGSRTVQTEGTISFISPVLDTASGLLEVHATFDNRKPEIRPGVMGEMLIEVSEPEL
ncbi:MAG: efflux RND transporter periplasmic adaptor subunit [Magnetococcales bacterium]|nr:efflux RND transporter periplasmic adaptor subunit [Magnetococcales bacterium]